MSHVRHHQPEVCDLIEQAVTEERERIAQALESKVAEEDRRKPYAMGHIADIFDEAAEIARRA